MDSWLNVRQQQALAVVGAINIRGHMNACMIKESDYPIHSAVVMPHRQYCIQFWCPTVREMPINWGKFTGGHWDHWGWTTCPVRNKVCSAWRREAAGGPNSSPPNPQ